MSGSCEASFFNRALSAFLSMIGTFVLLVRFGCAFKARGARINKTQKMESVYLHTNKETDVLIEPVSFHIESTRFILPSCLLTNPVPILILCCNEGRDQAKIEKNMNRDLIKLVERTQNSDKSLTNQGKEFGKTKKEVNEEAKEKNEKMHSARRNGHQILIQETVASEIGQNNTQPTQQDDARESKPIDQIHSDTRYRKRKSDVGKRCKNNSEETREGVVKNQSREEEPSTLEGIASIDRDDAPPSAISPLRNSASVKINLISKRRVLSKGCQTKRRFVKKS
ncbi:unnamed protein product [Litomosoides sigmodontis]|uniref:Uncharacterized protein n=1 Tax=Litomosoides sigmodontis TaxID=42156 RepID=A0A3P6SDW4_LITSI|nr:unnamed protein product [Litomosoides sigmodontis]